MARIPIAIWHDNEIIEGHGRLLAVMEMPEIETVPVIRLDDLTESQRKAYTIIHNKIAEKAAWDNELLGDELKLIMDEFDMTDLGFGEFELAILTEDFEPEPYDNNIMESYSQNESEYRAKQRVIIVYEPNKEREVLKLLGLESINKVVYDITEFGKNE